jgi:hypothetical protein
MCSWADTRGAVIAVPSEHHGTDDGYLPALFGGFRRMWHGPISNAPPWRLGT